MREFFWLEPATTERWMRDASCAFGRISNANAYIENACVYIEMPQGIISFTMLAYSCFLNTCVHIGTKPLDKIDFLW